MIVAVTGGKGGVGKSTLSWNVGRELDAVVVDADLATADLPRGRGPDLHDVLAGRAGPMEAVEEVGPVDLLPCGRTLAGARASDLSELGRVADLVARQCGHVVIDCPAGLAKDVGSALVAADVTLLVSTPRKPALLNAMRTRDLALDVDAPVACVALNRAPDGNFSGLVANVEEEFGAPVTLVREQDEVAEAQSRWQPVRDAYPDAPAVEAFETLARRLEACERRTGSPADAA